MSVRTLAKQVRRGAALFDMAVSIAGCARSGFDEGDIHFGVLHCVCNGHPISITAAAWLCGLFQGDPKLWCQSVQIGPRLEVKQETPDTFFGLPKLPASYATVVMPLLLSILMTCLVSLVSTLRGIGLAHNLLHVWLGAWAISWVIAFPTLLLVLPLVRRATHAIVRAE